MSGCGESRGSGPAVVEQRSARARTVFSGLVAALAFVSGFTGTYILNENGVADHSTTETPQMDASSSENGSPALFADLCGDKDMSASLDACFAAGRKNMYHREWRIWAGISSDLNSWPTAHNIAEEKSHQQRFQTGSSTTSSSATTHSSSSGGKTEVLPRTPGSDLDFSSTDSPAEAYSDGEGGRRLTDVTGKSTKNSLPEKSMGPQSEESADSDRRPSTGEDIGDTDPAFDVLVSNSYTIPDKGRNEEYAWQYIVEPYRASTLSVANSVQGATYSWYIDGHLHGYGTSIDVLFMEIGYHSVKVERLTAASDDESASISVSSTDSDEKTSHLEKGASHTSKTVSASSMERCTDGCTKSFKKGKPVVMAMADGSRRLSTSNAIVTSDKVSLILMCKYVRREVRTLSDLDREAWLSAVMVMQRVPTVVGQRLYGSKFYSKDHFTRTHLYYGGALDCDHWHQGAGFVTSHVALTLQWEQSLQAVNPSIAAPYWDFTIESTFFGASDWSTSFIFSDDWFGEASPDNDLHTVVDGRWSFVKTMVGARDYSHWVNSYGVMRAPWNSDPTPFLTRSGKVYGYNNNIKPSGCAEYERALLKTSWMAMSKQLNSAAHGHIHELMGGSWNHYYAEKLEGATAPAIFTFAHQIQALSKILWRYGYVECPEDCGMNTASSDCQCSCTKASLKGMKAQEVLQAAGILGAAEFFDKDYHLLSSADWLDENGDPVAKFQNYTKAETQHIYNQLLSLLCNPGHLGDMYQATSTNDITFWVIHNTVDRLWQYKRLGNLENYDETWDPFHTCYGHNPRNIQPFKNLFTDADGNADADDKYYTNMELYDGLHPSNRHLEYVYDTFEWAHCQKIGYKMQNS